MPMDSQIALLTAPEFNNGLTPSLIGNPGRKVNMGLKGLQICANSIMPMITYFGHSLVDRFATLAEQYNQNINSLGPGSANLARQSIDALQQYMAIALMFGMQAVDLRTYITAGHYDARRVLSPASIKIYTAVRQVMGQRPSPDRLYIRNDNEQLLSDHIKLLADDIAHGGVVPASVDGMVYDWAGLDHCTIG